MDNNNFVVELEAGLSREKIGGKGINLATMASAGFNIPPAIIIPVTAYDYFIKKELESKIAKIIDSINFNQENSISRGCSKIKELIKSEELPADMILPIKHKISELPEGYYAVRSSAVAEDLADASFAGQLDSFLNVKKEDILEKVVACWASYWNDRAVKYRHDSTLEQLETGLAIIVQKMVHANASGVIFTANPIDGTENLVMESAWGLGEAMASGMVSPDIFILNREGEILNQNIKIKEKAYFLQNGENTLIRLSEEDSKKPSLGESDLKRLYKIALDLEEYFQVPQDIEWDLESETSSIYILQSRPVTTLISREEQDDILWTRAYGDEYWADATTPLFYEVMGKMLTNYVNHEGARIMGYSEITDSPLLKLHKSRVYFNSWVLEKAFSYYPKFARSKELLNYFPLEDQERISQYPSPLHKTLISQLLVAIRDPDGLMHRTDKAYRKWALGFMQKCTYFDQKDLKSLSDQQLLSLYKEIEAAGVKHYQLIRYGMVSHSIATNLMIKNWLVEWLNDEDGSLYAGLITGLDDNKTVEMNIKFSDLAKILKEDPILLDKINSHDDLGNLSQVELEELLTYNKIFREGFHSFIADYGHRSNTREILYPRWREDKAYVLEVIKLLSSSDLDLREKELESRAHRIKTEKVVLNRIKNEKAGFIKVKIFSLVLKLAQTYLTFRENQRYYLDHLLFRQRLMLKEIGRRLKMNAIIDEVDDVFFLFEQEALQWADIGKLDYSLREEVVKRKKEFYRYKSSLPPKFLKNGVEFDDTIMEYDQNAIYGAAASPGLFTGRARVVETIQELGKLEEQEILITSNTDPAWTAVFSKLGGLITETGGILSHGAVISREYRIPAVTAVKGATKIFKTGEELMVDGNQGVVYKKE